MRCILGHDAMWACWPSGLSLSIYPGLALWSLAGREWVAVVGRC